MAHFAQLDENNVVTQVLVVPNEEEYRGQEFLANDLGLGGTWIQTSYNATIRGKFAGIGDTYDSETDTFIAPPPTEEELAAIAATEEREAARQAVLDRLGLTAEEAALLLGGN
jgi:hypothetical protein